MVDLNRRRDALAATWGFRDEIVVVGAGALQPIHGTDQFHEFRAHAEFRYLADEARPGEVLAFDPADGWTLFSPRLSEDEIVWHGGESARGVALDALTAWLAARSGRAVATLGRPVTGVVADEGATAGARAAVVAARRVKDAEERRRMRAAADATRFGFLAAMQCARAGLTEREVEIELEAGFLRAGARRPAFDSIVAAGTNAAVLHFEPTGRVLEAGELLLIDAGAEAGGYACDCTRTFLPEGAPTAEQRDLHQLILEVQGVAVAKCRPGTEYKQLHLEAQAQFAQGLVDFGLLRGRVDSLLERDAQTLFWPHGIGHLVGLAVHDVGGYLEGREPGDRPALKWLRADLPLAAGHAVTIEPGIYFIDALLNNPAKREEFADAVNWERVDALMDFGGIRIEDTVIVTDDAPEVLTSDVPKSLVVN